MEKAEEGPAQSAARGVYTERRRAVGRWPPANGGIRVLPRRGEGGRRRREGRSAEAEASARRNVGPPAGRLPSRPQGPRCPVMWKPSRLACEHLSNPCTQAPRIYITRATI